MSATLRAGQLAYDHVGSRVSWTIPDPEALLEQSTRSAPSTGSATPRA